MAGLAPALLRNPITLALPLATAWRGLGVPVPVPLHRLMLGGAAPASMVMLSTALSSLSLSAILGALR